MVSGPEIAAVEEIPDDSTLLFTVRKVDGGEREGDAGEEKEAILVELDGEVSGWLNYCQHLTHIKLDKGSGAPIRNGELVCANHGAYFESDTGYCTHGPCEGAVLDEVAVTVEDGAVHLADDDYEFVDRGPLERDPADLTSTSNVKF